MDYAIVGLDLNGVITSWNVGASNIMGWSSEQAIGHPVALFFTAEDVEARVPAAEMSAAVRHGRGIDERWHLRHDGSRFWANGEMMPLRNERGDLEGYVKILRDRTEQHNVAAALSDSEDRYRTLHDAMDEGFCLIEVRCDDAAKPIDYCFREVNAAFERQTGIADAPGKWMRELAPNHEQHWFDRYAEVARTGNSTRFALPAQALNGRWYEVFAYRVGDPSERLVAILFSDITDRRSTDARLRASEEHLREANATLRSNEANLRLLLDTISEGFYAVNRDGVTTTCNAAFLRMLGFSRAQDVIGRKIHDLIHHSHPNGAAYPAAECPIYLAASQGTPMHVAEELFFPIGRDPVWVEYWATPIVEDGVLQGAICTFQDITDRREQERARQEAEARRAALMEVGEQLRNSEDLAAMSALAAEIVGRTLGVTAAGFARVEDDDDLVVIERDWAPDPAHAIAGTHSMRDYGSHMDDLLANRVVVINDVRLDPRTAANISAYHAIGAAALINAPVVEQGRLAALFCVLSDQVRRWSDDEIAFVREVAERTRVAIERRRAEVSLRDLNARLEHEVEVRTAERDRMWNTSPDLMLILSPDGVYQRLNPAWKTVLGYEPAELVGSYATDLVLPDDLAASENALSSAQAGSMPVFENRLRHKDGSSRWVQWVAAPGPDEIFGIGRHITEAKEAEQRLAEAEGQLRQSQKMEAVGQLTGGLAHDFNNLLTGISGSLEMMAIRIGQGRMGDVEKYNTAAQAASKRAAALTHRLLAFSRRQTLDPKPTQPNRLIEGMMDLIERTVGPEIETRFVASDALWATLVDPHQLENAVLNLCINARDAMPDGGRVTIETSNVDIDERAGRIRELEPGRYVALCVSDNGTGMTPEVITKAFDPFFTTKPIGVGTGLGLSMIYGFARQSGGQVRIHSGEGEGTSVCIYLPRHLGPTEIEEATPDLAGAPRAEVGETVLVVDDEPSVRMLVTDVLEELGYTAIEAADGAAGLKVLQSDAHIDLLISDVGLPGGMNGRQMADAARVSRPDLKILFITGYAEAAVVGNGHLDPGMHVMTKPFAMEALATRIRTLIEGAKRGRGVGAAFGGRRRGED
ncbi:PAS domain S-box protein [Sphingomonas sp. BT553]|uniref:histidine kinase n=1 Tax=Sphingomonas mollis TaxID=2795726 RepID=A0ABS0XTV2_9SPHN|nr:PAS domain S-box protein [Sphingomonas sp. BT553]